MSTSSKLELMPVNEDEAQEHTTEAHGWLERAKMFEIDGSENFQLACQYVRDMRDNLSAVKKWWKPMVDSANKAHKTLTGRRNVVTQPYEQAIALLEQKVTAYRVEEKRVADAAAAVERRRLEKQERERREAEALVAADADDEVSFKRAERTIAAPVALPPQVAPAAILETAAPRIDNQRVTTKWKSRLTATMTDEDALRELCRYIGAGGPVAFVEPMWGALDAFGAGSAGSMKVPGIDFFEETKVTIPKSRGG